MKNKKGSALLLTLFLISGILIVAFGSSYLVVSNLQSSGLQYDSSRAYYTAESGAEYSLMKARRLGFDLKGAGYGNIFTDMIVGDNSFPGSFTVSYKSWYPSIILRSTGSYGITKRSVELNF